MEGNTLLAIDGFDIDKIERTCKQSREFIETKVESPIAREMFLLAHRFDTMSQEVLDSSMCTDMCPCLNFGVSINNNMRIVNSKDEYDLILEKYMETYKRTNFNYTRSTKEGNRPLVWTNDPEKGYKSIKECIEVY